MNPNRDREEQIFNAAREISSPEARAAYLAKACDGDAALHRCVEQMLNADAAASEFFETREAQPQAPTVRLATSNFPPLTEKAGDRIGRYKLLQKLGEGGCGVVYMAEQTEPVKRRVALKVIKLGMDTKAVVARFEAERQALALMDHPNIARVLDAGATEAGRPYFVMELVRGIRITEYCDQAHLSTRERLALFIQICQAVQHAHQKGIIHRDLKPSNILVTVNDGVPVPKVIDFGIAKATTGQQLTDKTLFTAYEQFIGTPAYMSPEQAVLTSLDIDTRTDIYSLGVLLYEMLTGRTPFDAQELLQAGLDEMRRRIREEEPQRPSTRLSTMLAADLTTVAQHHGAQPPALVNLLRGDLDWIVMKALEKDRARRYETANGLAMDIQRHLNNEPIVARPPSAAYRFQKLIRRNKLAFAAGAAVAGAMVLGVVVSTVQAMRAKRAERMAHEAAARAETEANHARTASSDAAKAQRVAESRLLRMNLDEGWRRIGEGDWFGALTPFTEALRMEQHDPERSEMHRLRLANVLRQCPRLVQAWSAGGRMTRAAFSPERERILTATALATNQAVAQIWDVVSGRPLTAPMEHAGEIRSVEWSTDGTRVLTASLDRTARVWDAATGRPLSSPLRHDAPLAQARFATKGNRVVTITADTETGDQELRSFVALWDIASGQSLWRAPGGKFDTLGSPMAVCLSPDDRFVIAGPTVIDAANGAMLHRLPDCDVAHYMEFAPAGDRALVTGHFFGQSTESARVLAGQDLRKVLAVTPTPDHPLHGRFAPDGRRMATFTDYSSVRVWDAATGLPTTGPIAHRGTISSIVFSADGRRMATACSDQTARVWDAITGLPFTHPLPHGSALLLAEFGGDEHRLVTAGEDGSIAVWDLRSGVPRFTWGPGPKRYAYQRIAISPDGRLVAAASEEGGTLSIWNLSTGELTMPPIFAGAGDLDIQFSADGRKLYSKSDSLRIWDVASGMPQALPPGYPFVQDADTLLSRDLEYAITRATNNIDIRVWKLATGDFISKLNSDVSVELELSPDGKQALGYTTNGTILVWNLPAPEPVIRFSAGDELSWLRWSADGRRVLTGGKFVRVWDIQSGQPVGPPLPPGSHWNSELSPDGRWVLMRGNGPDSGFQVWNAATGRRLPAASIGVMIGDSVFSPDGKLLAVASVDKTVQVWDVASMEPVTPPLAHPALVMALKFTPDSRSLLTVAGFSGSSLRIWDLARDNRSVAEWTELARFFGGKRDQEGKGLADDRAGTTNDENAGASTDAPAGTRNQNEARTNSPAFAATWLALRQKLPGHFTISEADSEAWERQAAASAEGHYEWDAAVRHLTRLLEAHPDNGEFLARRARAHARRAETTGTVSREAQLKEALVDYTRVLGWVDLHRETARSSRKPILIERSRVLRQLGRAAEAQADLFEAEDIPPRPVEAGPHLVDLTRWFNAGLSKLSPSFTNDGPTAVAPFGIRKLAGGVEFDLRGMIVFDSQSNSRRGEHPEAVTGIEIGRRCRRLHFLHTASAPREVPGTPTAKIVLRLANGEHHTLDVKLGDDLWNYRFDPAQSKPTKNSSVAWTGPADSRQPQGPQVRLFQTTWENPLPDVAVASIDYLSAMQDPTPYLLAITVEP